MPAAAARVLDTTSGPGVIGGPGVPTVLIGGMPAAVVGDSHVCGSPPPNSHPPSPFPPRPPAGMGIVLIGGRPPLRLGDPTACGAVITTGCPTVLIG